MDKISLATVIDFDNENTANEICVYTINIESQSNFICYNPVVPISIFYLYEVFNMGFQMFLCDFNILDWLVIMLYVQL